MKKLILKLLLFAIRFLVRKDHLIKHTINENKLVPYKSKQIKNKNVLSALIAIDCVNSCYMEDDNFNDFKKLYHFSPLETVDISLDSSYEEPSADNEDYLEHLRCGGLYKTKNDGVLLYSRIKNPIKLCVEYNEETKVWENNEDETMEEWGGYGFLLDNKFKPTGECVSLLYVKLLGEAYNPNEEIVVPTYAVSYGNGYLMPFVLQSDLELIERNKYEFLKNDYPEWYQEELTMLKNSNKWFNEKELNKALKFIKENK